MLECQSKLEQCRDFLEDLLHLGLHIAVLIDEVDFALFLRAINTRTGAGWPISPQVRVSITIRIRRRRRRANRVDTLDRIIAGVQELSSIGCAQKHTLGVFIESLIRIQASYVLANSNCEE